MNTNFANFIRKSMNTQEMEYANPKKIDEKEASIFSVDYYAENLVEIKPQCKVVLKKHEGGSNAKHVSLTKKEFKEIQDISRMTRISTDTLELYKGKVVAILVDNLHLFLKIDGKVIKPLYFPVKGSNIAIYSNKEFVTSYVVDGRAEIVDDKIRVLSTNEIALLEYQKEYDKAKALGLREPSFDRLLSKELWQIQDNEGRDENGEEIIKSLMWLDYTDFMDFPAFNVCWLTKTDKTGKISEDKWLDHDLEEFITQIRVSSLSQNGTTATVGEIDEEGFVVPGTIKEFFGTKGKFDISATNGVKSFKTVKNNPDKCLVVLAEVSFGERPINALGNILVTKEAFDEYKTLKTQTKIEELGVEYPAHKTFIKLAGEPVRVKGAASFINATAKVGRKKEKKVVILPPTEYTPNGTLEEDLDKFKFVATYRDDAENNPLQRIVLEVEQDGVTKTIETVGFYADVYEDAHHSALYSGLSVKHQNIFYYGAFAEMYRNNKAEEVKEALSNRIDQNLLNASMNFIGLKTK